MSDTLQQIRDLQYDDQGRAEALLLTFMQDNLPYDIASVELRPSAVSLNSFNGFMTLQDGTRLFFKTHTESNTVIQEYYNAELLAQAGYPVIQPVYQATEAGKQMLVYDVIDDPSVFDVAWQLETYVGANRQTDDDISADADTMQDAETEQADQRQALLSALTEAQEAADKQLYALYEGSLTWQSAEQAAEAPIHQLFYHRLVGGRLAAFYADEQVITLPDGEHTLGELRQLRLTINGQGYNDTLDDIIRRAITLLQPAQAGPSIIGHGDAHNGNVFFRQADKTLTYFDPAFAGHHHPLLDLVKPLFHNVFAMWMYFPGEKAVTARVDVETSDTNWTIHYDYGLPAVRRMFMRSKMQYALLPTLRLLKDRGWLVDNWRAYLKAGLFCCPFLTMNLADAKRFPPKIAALGLAMAIEMGAESNGQKSLIDKLLDDVALML
jgi:hypothetical protein